jgi:hypothetical protein
VGRYAALRIAPYFFNYLLGYFDRSFTFSFNGHIGLLITLLSEGEKLLYLAERVVDLQQRPVIAPLRPVKDRLG